MKVIGYVRVSTEEQSAEGVSLAAQEAKIRAYADLYDLELIEVIVDAGQSAKSLKRPGLTRALGMLKAGKAGGMVIAKLDRLSRNVSDFNSLIEGYFGEKAGKQLMSVADSIDTRTAAGRLVLNVLMSVSQWEREAIGERTKDAMSHKKSKGERVGTIPFGFDLAANGVDLISNEIEQSVIADIRRLKGEGYSLRSIAEELTRQGASTKKGKAKWSHMTVAGILNRAA